MEATGCTETLVPIHQTTWLYIPENMIFESTMFNDGSGVRFISVVL
jgi:hypothetical protein